ncbi:MAG: TIGR01777 family protein [Gemmatimonadetes bacterium]|nr:TIGR01777 family protein [Gemmatimonadota bacterium]
MVVAVTGASGLIGGLLIPVLAERGHRVVRLVRRPPRHPTERQWAPDGRPTDPATFADVDVVVHLAAESIAAGRWTPARKAAIWESRVTATGHLASAVAAGAKPTSAFVAASAIGYYGNRGDAELTEADGPGTGFLADLAVAWEAAAAPLAARGIRTVAARFGLVLSTRGGALGQMLLPFRVGLGAQLGSGRQWMSWIGESDTVAALVTLVEGPLSGPVNLTAPAPVTNAEFTKTLAQVLNRPALLCAPAPLLRLLLGEFADEGLLASARVLPRALDRAGYQFRQPRLRDALKALLDPSR